mgnify:CR=1 FL=1|jgi:hypothetical protein
MMGYDLWDMVQRDINIGMNMHAMIQVLCVVWVPCVLFVQIQHPLKLAGSFFCCYRDTPQSVVFFLLIFDCLASPVNSIILYCCD